MNVARWFEKPIARECLAFDDKALKEWIVDAFGIRSQEEADRRIGEINARQERIVVDHIAYVIPDECYKTMTVYDFNEVVEEIRALEVPIPDAFIEGLNEAHQP